MFKDNTTCNFDWNEESGICTCTIVSNGDKFSGTATCSTEDKDMKSRLVGEHISHQRACISQVKCAIKDCKKRIAVIHQLYYSINQSPKFKRDAYETHMILKAYKREKSDLESLKELLFSLKKELKNYLEEKERFYKKIRRLRS